MLCDFYAERAERRGGNVYIRSALDRRKNFYHAVAAKQRKRKQKSRYELAADIAAQDILACRKRTEKLDSAAVFFNFDALIAEKLLVYSDSSFKQPGCTLEPYSAAGERRRYHKAQRASAFAAAQYRTLGCFARFAAYFHRVAELFVFCAERGDAVECCEHILAFGNSVYRALALGEGGAYHQAMRIAFRRRRAYLAAKARRTYFNLHFSLRCSR